MDDLASGVRAVTIYECDSEVRIEFNDDMGAFDIPHPAGKALLERIARICLAAWIARTKELMVLPE
jgi:hypothetical protein